MSCGCSFCVSGCYGQCDRLHEFKDHKKLITMQNHNFSALNTNADISALDDQDLDENEANEQVNQFVHTEASKTIQAGEIAGIKTEDDYPYYLLMLTRSPYETVSTVTDDYNHVFPPMHRVVEGNYLEVHREVPNGKTYYLDTRKKALISAYCVVGNCPQLPHVTGKKR